MTQAQMEMIQDMTNMLALMCKQESKRVDKERKQERAIEAAATESRELRNTLWEERKKCRNYECEKMKLVMRSRLEIQKENDDLKSKVHDYAERIADLENQLDYRIRDQYEMQ